MEEPQVTWAQEIVQCLLAQRDAGVTDFTVAWRRASHGLERPRDWVRASDDVVPFSTWFRGACAREWNGEVQTDFINLHDLLDDIDTQPDRTRITPTGTERVTVLA